LGDFERDTAVAAGGEGSYACDIRPGWWVVAGPNGGYLAAMLVRALEDHLSDGPLRPLRSLTIHYLRAPREGAARIFVEVERAGRSVSFVSVRLEQADRVCALARAVLALDRDGFELAAAPPPDVPGPDEVEAIPDSEEAPPFGRQFEFRPALGSPPFSGAAEALTGGWIRLRERGRHLDAALLTALCDSWYPAVSPPPANRWPCPPSTSQCTCARRFPGPMTGCSASIAPSRPATGRWTRTPPCGQATASCSPRRASWPWRSRTMSARGGQARQALLSFGISEIAPPVNPLREEFFSIYPIQMSVSPV